MSSPDQDLASSGRESCWCGQHRKPCEYHEGFDDGQEEAAAEIERLEAKIAELC